MKLQMFTVRDRQSNTYGTPMFLPSAGVCIRSLADEVNNGKNDSIIRSHPEDFELFLLGEWDTDTARFSPLSDPQSLALCQNLKTNGS